MLDVRVLRRIVFAWVLTFPSCALIADIAALIANRLWPSGAGVKLDAGLSVA
jgi:hypothetical protein